MIPEPIIQRRPVRPDLEQTCLAHGLTPLQARIASARLQPDDPLEAILFPKLRQLQPLSQLHHADCAGRLIADACQNQAHIAVATDYDADGVTAAWVIREALLRHFGHPPECLSVFLNRRANGYGLNDTLVDEILARHRQTPIALVITADQGGCDEPRIARLKAAGITVVVTDHHQLDQAGPPPSADCVVNPQKSACHYDPAIAGCMVAFLVMNQVRRELINRGWLPADAPSLKDLLPKVALGTIADSVSLKSPNNRAVVRAGLQAINRLQHPVWQAVQRFSRTRSWMDAEFIAFEVATRINAASRVNDVNLALSFLSAQTVDDALIHLKALDKDNQYRKQQQQDLLRQAHKQAKAQVKAARHTLCVVLQGTPGIQGIIAQRIGEHYGRPTVAFTDLQDGTLAGSGRGIVPQLDLNEAFRAMQAAAPQLFLSLGGHAGAAGCMIPKDQVTQFHSLLEEAVRQQLGDTPAQPMLLTDGTLLPGQLHPGLIEEINALSPYGQGWPAPLFDNHFEVISAKTVGAEQSHLSLVLRLPNHGRPFPAIYFNGQSPGEPLHFAPGQTLRAVYRPTLSTFAGRQQFQLRIQWAKATES
ncbi:MAG TPA: DHH family phosphoesterase [Piscirickettsiaceae bacterium]|nr:DHH family phosphoesterase [Piscirickettsiaceae bacterium]